MIVRLLGAGALLALCACETTSPTYSAANAPVYQPYYPPPPMPYLDPNMFDRVVPQIVTCSHNGLTTTCI